jgi:hypothetical protein
MLKQSQSLAAAAVPLDPPSTDKSLSKQNAELLSSLIKKYRSLISEKFSIIRPHNRDFDDEKYVLMESAIFQEILSDIIKVSQMFQIKEFVSYLTKIISDLNSSRGAKFLARLILTPELNDVNFINWYCVNNLDSHPVIKTILEKGIGTDIVIYLLLEQSQNLNPYITLFPVLFTTDVIGKLNTKILDLKLNLSAIPSLLKILLVRAKYEIIMPILEKLDDNKHGWEDSFLFLGIFATNTKSNINISDEEREQINLKLYHKHITAITTVLEKIYDYLSIKETAGSSKVKPKILFIAELFWLAKQNQDHNYSVLDFLKTARSKFSTKNFFWNTISRDFVELIDKILVCANISLWHAILKFCKYLEEEKPNDELAKTLLNFKPAAAAAIAPKPPEELKPTVAQDMFQL